MDAIIESPNDVEVQAGVWQVKEHPQDKPRGRVYRAIKKRADRSPLLLGLDNQLTGDLRRMLARAKKVSVWQHSTRRMLIHVLPILFVGMTLLAVGDMYEEPVLTFLGAVIAGVGYITEIAMLINSGRRLLPEDVVVNTYELILCVEDERAHWGMISTQAAVNKKIEALAKQYERLPLLLATGDAAEKITLEAWGAGLAAELRTWKPRVMKPSFLGPKELLEYLGTHLRLQLQNRWDELPVVDSSDGPKVNSGTRQPMVAVFGVGLVLLAVSLPAVGAFFGLAETSVGAIIGVLAMTVLDKAGVSKRVISRLGGALNIDESVAADSK
jgi:hypothetical protein